jgi:geranylgeranyl pyrophosphate synthase/predicted secreted hydrolase
MSIPFSPTNAAFPRPAPAGSRSARRRVEGEFPDDWPGPGVIDLAVHDLPHASSALEWWYVNSHFETEEGRKLGVFAAFFRELKGEHPVTGQRQYAHSITWALSDAARQRFYPYCAVDAGAPEFGLRKLDAGAGVEDERLNRAMREVLARNRIPGPTHLLESGALVRGDRLELDYGGDQFSKRPDGCYELRLFDASTKSGCRLTFKPMKPPTRHGDDGVCHGVADELMFYYFIPRCELTGSVVVDGEERFVRRGTGWYDHEFGFVPKKKVVPLAPVAPAATGKPKSRLTAWTWAALQLENGTDVTVYANTRIATGEVLDNRVIISDARGRRRQLDRMSLTPLSTWNSIRSFVEYPTSWKLSVPEADLDLRIDATFADQEVLTVISDPGFWEGQVTARGYCGGAAVVGRGWVERKGFRFNQLDEFFKAASKEVRRQVDRVLPREPRPGSDMQQLVARRGGDSYTEGLDPKQLGRALVEPIREIVDRGGKAWRSYAALACIDVVGGDSRKYAHWLAMPELLHVGSLIVDDVEDQSDVRRGGATSHKLFGEALAINAGTAAYFLCEPDMRGLPLETKVRIYELYFDGMRAGHAGQAIDIDGLAELVPRALETGDISELERRVLAIHRLKTAVPAGMAARIGAILGRGSELQIDGVGKFFEAIGLAFQIVDDVLNLRGFKGDLKLVGEDIQQGKLTLPIIRGLGRLPEKERHLLWEKLAGKPRDPQTIGQVISALESVGAIESCAIEARQLVEEAWSRLDPLVPDTQYKVMFRAFGWYVLERHY